MPQTEQLYDVIGVDIDTNAVRIISTNRPREKAEERRQITEDRCIFAEMFYVTPSGKYKDGDTYREESPNAD